MQSKSVSVSARKPKAKSGAPAGQRSPGRLNVLEQLSDRVGQGIEELLAHQQELQRQVEQMSRLLTVQQEMLTGLIQRRPDTGGTGGDPLVRRPGSSEPTPIPAGASEWRQRVRQGEALRAGWVKDGLLVPSSALVDHWSRSRQALDQACARGELFSLKLGKNRYYPAAFLHLDADAVKRVNLALKGDDSTAKFVFWSRGHGALGNRSVAEALNDGRLEQVVELARGWSEERGFVEAATA